MKTKSLLKVVITLGAVSFLTLIVIAGTPSLFAVLNTGIFLFFLIRTLVGRERISHKALYLSAYLLILILQMIFFQEVIFDATQTGKLFLLEKFTGMTLMIIPFVIEYFYRITSYKRKRFPSKEDISAVSFETLASVRYMADTLVTDFGRTKNSFHINNIENIVKDLPRHSNIRYINKNSLSSEYFRECRKSLNDPHMYLVISDTGSPASELISVFTRVPFNHASLSFDRDLKTIVSYNKGENLFPPGLNREQIDYFNKKKDASIIVYSIVATRKQKEMILDKLHEINKTGSAYNLVGLVTKSSLRPNIMFCSQFVYNILSYAGLAYFDSKAGKVKPIDLVEKDYRRMLNYCYEIQFEREDEDEGRTDKLLAEAESVASDARENYRRTASKKG